MKLVQKTLLSTLLSASVLVSGCGTTKPSIKPVQYVPVPQHLLVRRCAELRISDAQTWAELEALALEAWTCVMDSNKDKADIEALK